MVINKNNKTIRVKTEFGKRLVRIRNKAIRLGLKLLSSEEIIKEVKIRRAGDTY